MAILKRRSRMISFRLSEDEYASLRSLCENEGARSVSDLARDAVHRLIVKDSQADVELTLREHARTPEHPGSPSAAAFDGCRASSIGNDEAKQWQDIVAFGQWRSFFARLWRMGKVPRQHRVRQPDNAAFLLGPGDVIQITAIEAEEVSKGPIRISSDGYINLPTLGRLKAADRTPEELQSDIADRLKRLIVDPDVSVSVVESHSQPVSVLGAVKTPGVIQLQGHKTLIEVMSLVGGLARGRWIRRQDHKAKRVWFSSSAQRHG